MWSGSGSLLDPCRAVITLNGVSADPAKILKEGLMRYINEAGLNLLKSFETMQLGAYDDGYGVWTIGWGHTGQDVVEGLQINEAKAQMLLLDDLQVAEGAVERLVKSQLSDNQFSALVCLVFNIGMGNFEESTLLRMLNGAGPNYSVVADQFDRWNKSKGVVSNGLVKRRAAEKELFLTP